MKKNEFKIHRLMNGDGNNHYEGGSLDLVRQMSYEFSSSYMCVSFGIPIEFRKIVRNDAKGLSRESR